jgi:hypothetical protein
LLRGDVAVSRSTALLAAVRPGGKPRDFACCFESAKAPD